MKILLIAIIAAIFGQLIVNYPNLYEAVHNAYFNIFGMIGYLVTKYLMEGCNE